MADSVGAVHIEFTTSTAAFRAEVAKGAQAVEGFSAAAKRSAQGAAQAAGASGTYTASFGKMGEQVRGASASIAGFTQAFAALGATASPAVKGLGTAMSGLMAGGFTPLGIAIGVTTAAVAAYVSSAQKAEERTRAWTEQLKEANKELLAAQGGGSVLFQNRIEMLNEAMAIDAELPESKKRDEAVARVYALMNAERALDDLKDDADKKEAARKKAFEEFRLDREIAANAEGVEMEIWLQSNAKRIASMLELAAVADDARKAAESEAQASEESRKKWEAAYTVAPLMSAAEIKAMQDLGVATDQWQRDTEEAATKVAEALAEVSNDIASESMTATEREIAAYRERYAALLAETEKYGVDATALRKKIEERAAQLAAAPSSLRGNRSKVYDKAGETLDNPDASFVDGFSAQVSVIRANLMSIAEMGAYTADSLADGFSNAFADFVTGAKSASEAFKAFAGSFLRDIAGMIAKQFALSALTAGLGAVGLALPAFAEGGSFNVRGTGGTDSQLVAFRATPGEQVDVRTPGQMAKGAGGVTVNVYNSAPNTSVRTESREGPSGTEIRAFVEQVVSSDLERGGPIARTAERTHGLQRRGRRG